MEGCRSDIKEEIGCHFQLSDKLVRICKINELIVVVRDAETSLIDED